MTKQKLIQLVKQSYDIHGEETFFDDYNLPYCIYPDSPTWIEIIERWNWFRNVRKYCIKSILICKDIKYLGLGTYELTYNDNGYQRDIYKIYSRNIKFTKNKMEYKRR